MFLEASEDEFAHEVARAQVGNRLSTAQTCNFPKHSRSNQMYWPLAGCRMSPADTNL